MAQLRGWHYAGSWEKLTHLTEPRHGAVRPKDTDAFADVEPDGMPDTTRLPPQDSTRRRMAWHRKLAHGPALAPWRSRCQDDGWWLRSAIVWHMSRNPMPESVRDRPIERLGEMIFLLTKQPTYYYDGEAIRYRAVTRDVSN